MRGRLPSYLPSGDYVIYSLVNGPLGSAFVKDATGNVPVIVPSLGSYPQKFHINLVDELNPIYVITVDGRNTRDEEHLVYAGHEEAQKWVAIYWQPQNAFTITKFNTNETWTEPDRRDLGKLGQICIEAVTGINHYYPHPRQLFRFKLVQGHKLPSGNYRIRSLISNQPLGIQPVTWHGPGYPAVVPVAGAAPQTFAVQQVNGSEDTYRIRVKRYTQDERSHFPSPQQWVITHRERQDAYTIVKLNTHQAWTEPDQYSCDGRHDPDTPRQIRLEPLAAGIYCDIYPNQLFRFEALLEPRLLISNFSMQSPTVTQSTVQQADGSEDTYVIKVQRMRTGNERGHAYALLNPPTTCDVGPAPNVTHQLVELL